eukprot:1322585-Rhodomonas_salina.1
MVQVYPECAALTRIRLRCCAWSARSGSSRREAPAPCAASPSSKSAKPPKQPRSRLSKQPRSRLNSLDPGCLNSRDRLDSLDLGWPQTSFSLSFTEQRELSFGHARGLSTDTRVLFQRTHACAITETRVSPTPGALAAGVTASEAGAAGGGRRGLRGW